MACAFVLVATLGSVRPEAAVLLAPADPDSRFEGVRPSPAPRSVTAVASDTISPAAEKRVRTALETPRLRPLEEIVGELKVLEQRAPAPKDQCFRLLLELVRSWPSEGAAQAAGFMRGNTLGVSHPGAFYEMLLHELHDPRIAAAAREEAEHEMREGKASNVGPYLRLMARSASADDSSYLLDLVRSGDAKVAAAAASAVALLDESLNLEAVESAFDEVWSSGDETVAKALLTAMGTWKGARARGVVLRWARAGELSATLRATAYATYCKHADAVELWSVVADFTASSQEDPGDPRVALAGIQAILKSDHCEGHLEQRVASLLSDLARSTEGEDWRNVVRTVARRPELWTPEVRTAIQTRLLSASEAEREFVGEELAGLLTEHDPR